MVIRSDKPVVSRIHEFKNEVELLHDIDKCYGPPGQYKMNYNAQSNYQWGSNIIIITYESCMCHSMGMKIQI